MEAGPECRKRLPPPRVRGDQDAALFFPPGLNRHDLEPSLVVIAEEQIATDLEA